jgi:tetratricopeptide (TPR) repeat protein
MQVKAWQEYITIPTYEIGQPQKNPVFLERRVYQGSSGVVYPYPVIEEIFDEKKDKKWKALFLENDFLKIMILPELGGRVQMAYDKVNKRHFIYYNQVIKPALVGLTGPWISGGIEFNWPQHHRPSTYLPVDYTIEKNNDGSITVWCSEIERMFRTKGMAGFTLYPDKSYMEIKVKLYNRTPHPQTFLWWANPAVKVNDHYQSVFPPDVNAVFDHGKRDVSDFPVATGTYYKVDYSAGVDISRYKNIPVPTSYMAVKSDYDFIGCYEHDTKGGMLHVASHHISPGKKQWTWGKGDFGLAWDRNLTDEDGPYIELMCGVYTDNQPDFSWLMPYEEKAFSQFFMPYSDLGLVKNATKEAILNLEVNKNKVFIGVSVTSFYNDAQVHLYHYDNLLYQQKTDLAPLVNFKKTIETDKALTPEGFRLEVKSSNGQILVAWNLDKKTDRPIPEPAKAALKPSQIKHNEQLYLTGLHLEQYRHAHFKASDYYKEALNRDPGDVRCNNALGLLQLKKGRFENALGYFNKAIETLTERNPNPYNGEPFFNLGLAQRFLYKDDEAYEAFYKAIWNDSWQAAGYFQLALIDCKNKKYDAALELIDKSLIRQWHNHKARHLKAALLRLSGKDSQAQQLIDESLKIDAFNFGICYEDYLIKKSEEKLTSLKKLISGNIHNYIEIALDYAWAGLYDETISFLKTGIDEQKNYVYPMAWYYLAWFYTLKGEKEQAFELYNKAESETPGTCFPNQPEAVLALNDCIQLVEKSGKAPYYLGNFYYNNQQYDLAIKNWERSVANKPDYPTAHRNLALAYFNKANKKTEALAELEKAFDLDTSDARVFMELNGLYKNLNRSTPFRLDLMQEHFNLVNSRDDLYLEYITALNIAQNYRQALDLIVKRKFHPWEGGEGKVAGQYVLSLVELAKKDINNNNFKDAIEKLERAKVYPHNLGEGKLYGARENDIDFWIGYCYEKSGDRSLADSFYHKASGGLNEPLPAIFYNDQQPDKIFYQGLALHRLNKKNDAHHCFTKLVTHGKEHLSNSVKIDYFAVSLPDLMIWDDDLNIKNEIYCRYLIGLGHLGLDEMEKAKKELEKVIQMEDSHSGAHIHLNGIENNTWHSVLA